MARDEAVFFGLHMSSDVFVRIASVLHALYQAAGLTSDEVYVDDTIIVVQQRLTLPALVIASSCACMQALPLVHCRSRGTSSSWATFSSSFLVSWQTWRRRRWRSRGQAVL